MPASSTAWPASASLPRAVWERALGDVARDILGRPSRQFRARMCELGWRLADGPGEVPALLPALVEIVHAGSLIIDDIEDGSKLRRGAAAVHLVHGVPRTLNTGTWMYFWALDLVDQLPAAARRARADPRRHGGGAPPRPPGTGARSLRVDRTDAARARLSHRRHEHDVEDGSAHGAGGRLRRAGRGGASDDFIEALAQFGRRLGLGLQMLDDFGNLTAPTPEASDAKALEDLRNGRPTWPWAHAATELDAAAFSQLQASARRSAKCGDPDGTRARALAAELRMAVGMKGRRQAAAYLDSALRELRGRIGDRDELALLASEIERLEVSYGLKRGWRSSGAGSAGLAAGIRLQAAGVRTVMYEARDRAGRPRLRLPGPGLHLRRRADRHHRAALPGGAVRAGGRADGRPRDAGSSSPVLSAAVARRDAGSTTAATPSRCAPRWRRWRPAIARGSTGSWTTAAACSRPGTKGWSTRRSCASSTWCGSLRSWPGCAPIARSTAPSAGS